jgi:hypothetical protein
MIIKGMKIRFNLFLIVAVMSIAMFTACGDEKEGSSSLMIDQTDMDVLSAGGETVISINTDMQWNAAVKTDWVELSPSSGSGSGTVKVTVKPLEKGPRRVDTITFIAGSTIKTTRIQQRGNLESDYYTSGDVIRLHRHTVGNGIAIVILGDGFDMEDCKKGGVYEYNCRKVANLFLSMPIIRDYKTYFDIYARVDVSRERGARNCVEDPDNCPQNAYGVGHPDFDWGKMHENATITAGKDDRSIIFMANGMVGGHVINGIAVYSANEPNKHYWMMHEFAGHVVGGFPDLYYMGYEGQLTEAKKKSFDDNHEGGELLMLDWPTDPTKVYWKEFIGKNGYEMVGIYPAHYYDPPLSYGQIQCCEDITTSVMHGMIAHYSVMERYQLWRKIQLRAGFTTITKDEFLTYDVVNIVDADWSFDRYDNWTDDRIWGGN